MIYVAQGHDASALEPIAVELFIDEYPHYEIEVCSDGIARPVGGATVVLSTQALSYDEAIELLDQFGLSLTVPSAECTIAIPDLHRVPTPFYGVVELELYKSSGAWWENFRLTFRRLVAVE